MPEPAYHVEHLDAGGAVSTAVLGEVFLAAWRRVELVALAPGAALGPRTLGDSEAMAYVTGGEGTAHLEHGPVALREGIALTLFKDERLHLEAGEAGLEVFLAEIGTQRP